MKEEIKRVAEKILLLPPIKHWLDRICLMYYYDDVNTNCAYYKTMQAALDKRLDIGSEISKGDAAALDYLLSLVMRKGIKVAEVGSWKGLSTAVIAETIKVNTGSLYAIDHWQGSKGTALKAGIGGLEPLVVFKRNMTALKLSSTVFPIVMSSTKAVQIIANSTMDLVFIDADHNWTQFKEDVKNWLPKLKPKGIICGHDCEGYYSKLTDRGQRELDAQLSTQYSHTLKCHPGVIRGLYDIFKDEHSIIPDSLIWYKTNEEGR